MIEPNLATMLCFITTDAKISGSALKAALKTAVAGSFNAITVDGDMSTNDTVLVLANGESGHSIVNHSPLHKAFTQALSGICADLAEHIVADGERISKVVSVEVSGAKSAREAEKVARAIGNSLLVKTSWYGNDPNWGRVIDAAGYAGVAFSLKKFELSYAPSPDGAAVPAFRMGEALPGNEAQWRRIVAEPRFRILLNLHQGSGHFRLLATDLTEGYVDFNKAE